MRLAEHSLHCYQLPYERPVKWSDIVETAAPFVLLRLRSDSGAVGVGEITVKPTWCGVTARSLIAAVEDVFLPQLPPEEFPYLNESAAQLAASGYVPSDEFRFGLDLVLTALESLRTAG